MAEDCTPDQSVALVVGSKCVDADDPMPVYFPAGFGTAVTIADGADAAQGTTTDAATANTVIGRLKKLISLLPTALGAHGGLVVEGVASGVAVPSSVADGANVTIGALADAEVSGAGAASVIAILKRIRTLLAFSTNAGTTDATTLRVITASDGPLNTAIGATSDAGVSTDAVGSVSAKLRGLIILIVNLLSRWPAALGVSGGLQIEPAKVLAANILNGVLDSANGTLITIPANRTWRGEVVVSCSAIVASGGAIGNGFAKLSTAGTGVTPAAGLLLAAEASAPASAASGVGTVGHDTPSLREVYIIAPVGNSVSITLATSGAAIGGAYSAAAYGVLL